MTPTFTIKFPNQDLLWDFIDKYIQGDYEVIHEEHSIVFKESDHEKAATVNLAIPYNGILKSEE